MAPSAESSLRYDRVSINLTLERLPKEANVATSASKATSASMATVVYKPDGSRFTHAASTIKLLAGGVYGLCMRARARRYGANSWDELRVCEAEIINVSEVARAQANLKPKEGAFGRPSQGGMPGEAQLELVDADRDWVAGMWDCDLPASNTRGGREALELLVGMRHPDEEEGVDGAAAAPSRPHQPPRLRLPLLVKCYPTSGRNARNAANGSLLKAVRFAAKVPPIDLGEVLLAEAEAFVALPEGEALEPRAARALERARIGRFAAMAREAREAADIVVE